MHGVRGAAPSVYTELEFLGHGTELNRTGFSGYSAELNWVYRAVFELKKRKPAREFDPISCRIGKMRSETMKNCTKVRLFIRLKYTSKFAEPVH